MSSKHFNPQSWQTPERVAEFRIRHLSAAAGYVALPDEFGGSLILTRHGSYDMPRFTIGKHVCDVRTGKYADGDQWPQMKDGLMFFFRQIYASGVAIQPGFYLVSFDGPVGKARWTITRKGDAPPPGKYERAKRKALEQAQVTQ